MFKSSVESKAEVSKARSIIHRLEEENKLDNFVRLRDWWLFESSDAERKSLIAFVGFDKFEHGFSRPKYDALMLLPHFGSANVDKEKVIEMFGKNQQTVLHQLKGRLLESKAYRDVDVIFSSHAPLRLYKYMIKLGFKKPEELLELYRAGGLGQQLKEDAEYVLSMNFINEVIPEDTEVLFGENISNILTLIPEEKYKYLRIARFINVPGEIANKLGRNVKMTYTGDLNDLVDNLESTGKYTQEEIDYLRDFIVDGAEARKNHNISIEQASELANALYSLT